MGPPTHPPKYFFDMESAPPALNYLLTPARELGVCGMRAIVIDPCGQPQIYEETVTGSTKGIVEIIRGSPEPVRINDTEVMYVIEDSFMDSDCHGGFIVLEKADDGGDLTMKRFYGRAVVLGLGKTGRHKSTGMELLTLSRSVCVLPGKRIGPSYKPDTSL